MLHNVFYLDEICYMLPQTIVLVSPIFVMGIITAETCGNISRGPGLESWSEVAVGRLQHLSIICGTGGKSIHEYWRLIRETRTRSITPQAITRHKRFMWFGNCLRPRGYELSARFLYG